MKDGASLAAADVPRFARLSVIADMQPTFCCGEAGLNVTPGVRGILG